MPWWAALLLAVGSAIAGGFVGFFVTRKMINKELEKNPPISENQIRVMYQQMGRKASEADIRRVMNAMKNANKKP